MSYLRVIPRDLFNEASLLKCYGKVCLNLEIFNPPNVQIEHDGEAFDVEQYQDSGAIYLTNVVLRVHDYACTPYRPLNSREAWPLYLTDPDGLDIAVFADDGSFSPEFVEFLAG